MVHVLIDYNLKLKSVKELYMGHVYANGFA